MFDYVECTVRCIFTETNETVNFGLRRERYNLNLPLPVGRMTGGVFEHVLAQATLVDHMLQ